MGLEPTHTSLRKRAPALEYDAIWERTQNSHLERRVMSHTCYCYTNPLVDLLRFELRTFSLRGRYDCRFTIDPFGGRRDNRNLTVAFYRRASQNPGVSPEKMLTKFIKFSSKIFIVLNHQLTRSTIKLVRLKLGW